MFSDKDSRQRIKLDEKNIPMNIGCTKKRAPAEWESDMSMRQRSSYHSDKNVEEDQQVPGLYGDVAQHEKSS